MANNKVQLADGTTLIDLTSDTVTPQTMIFGATAHDRSGEQITGVVELANAGTATPEMDGTAAVGTSTKYAREDHVHPSDTSKLSTSLKGANNGLAELDSSGKVPTSQLPSYVDDYGVCDTVADVQIKEVTITGLTVATGTTIHVSFTNANSASQPKLSVNGDTAKFMVSYGSTAIGTTDSTTGWQAGSVLTLTYNGTYWVRNRSYNTNTTYTNESLGNGRGTCTPTSGSTALTATLSGYALTTGGRVTILFSGDVPANATLNINSKGAKFIMAKGANGIGNIAEGVIKSGDTATFIYDGSFYQLLSIDRIGLVDVPAIESKLSGIEAGAEVNVNADWNASSGDAQILNKPSNLVQDASYVHTDNNFTSTLLTKLNGIESGAEVNVQADWSVSTTTSDAYIKNKPTLGSIVSFNVTEVTS